MSDLTEEERVMAMSLWLGVVLFSAILYLTGSYWKAILIGTFVLGSNLVGFGRLWLLRGSFAIAIVAVAVALRAPINGRSYCRMLDKPCSRGSPWLTGNPRRCKLPHSFGDPHACGVVSNVCCDVSSPRKTLFESSAASPPKP